MRRSGIPTLSLIAVATLASCARVDRVTAPTDQAPSAAAAKSLPVAISLAPSFANLTGPVPAPPGLRACFAGENNGLDVVSNNVGVRTGVGLYGAGRFGNAFDFTALYDGVEVPASASLNVGVAPGLTMSAWIFARGTMFQTGPAIYGAGPIVEFDNGAHMWQHNQQNSPTGFFANLAEGNAPSQWHIVQVPGVVPLGALQHTAVTYDKASGRMTLYVNGVAVVDSARGTFSANTTTIMRIGARETPIIGASQFGFNGLIDEVQLYDRGLSAAEVAQLASATGTMCVAPPASYRVATMPSGSAESGVPFSPPPVVHILDATGNIVLNATTAVTATVASGSGQLLGTTTVNAVSGVATFTDLAIGGAANTSLLFTTTVGLPPATGSPTTSPAIATTQVARKLGITTQPGGAPSGSSLVPQPVVEIQDAAGVRMPAATNVVTVAVASGSGTMAGATSATAVNGTASFGGLAVTGIGPVSLAFSSPTLTSVTSNPFTVTGLAATQLAVFTQPGGAASGLPFVTQPVIEVRDASGNRAPGATGTVTASILSGTGALVGTATATIINGLASFSDLQINGGGAFTLQFASTGLTSATSTSLTVTQVVSQIVIVAGPTVITSGITMAPSWSLELRDAAGIKVATANQTVIMSLISGSGTLAGVRQLTSVAGVATFPDMTFTGTGPVRFNFVRTGVGGDLVVETGSVPVQAPQLAVLTQPAGAESGLTFTTQPVVEVRDANGAVVTGATGSVTATIATGTGGTLVGTTTVPIVAGRAAFTNLQINGTGTFTLGFTSAGITGVNSANLTVTQSVRQMAIVSGPTLITSGVTMTPAWLVELRDATGTRIATSTAPVTMSVGQGALSGTTVTNAAAGLATFGSATFTGTGPVVFTFTSGSSSVASSAITVQVNSIDPSCSGGLAFRPPVDGLPQINKAEGGSTVPLKFCASGNGGLDIFAVGHPASQPASCSTFLPTGPATPIASAAEIAADLKYNDKTYHLNWQTLKAWDGTCRILTIKLKNNSVLTAHFTIK